MEWTRADAGSYRRIGHDLLGDHRGTGDCTTGYKSRVIVRVSGTTTERLDNQGVTCPPNGWLQLKRLAGFEAGFVPPYEVQGVLTLW